LFFVSDTHFGHNKDFVYGKRGFANVGEHDSALIHTINATVGENDILVHCGDFSLNTSRERFDQILDELNCRSIYYLWGTHNSPSHAAYFEQLKFLYPNCEGIEVYPLRYRNLMFVGDYLEIEVTYQKSSAHIGGKNIVCCHYPIQEFNNAKRGYWMLCGHSHYGNPLTRAGNPSGKYLDLGWEGHGKPLSFAEVSEIMSKKEVLQISHH
jgi:calcineurin-like phosphoesterase family protein